MVSLLTRAFGGDYGEFHDKLIDDSTGIFNAFVKGCVKMFSRISEEVDRTSTLSFANFVEKSISFGPDRALFAYKNCDQMLVKFDCGLYESYTDNLIGNAVPYLPNLREICNVHFREDFCPNT